MVALNFPKLSEYDPVTKAEGALDPIGLYTIADRLALRLVPGIRERMSHPRFLTAMVAGHVITSLFDEDELAVDSQTPPYLVYEWHAVEGIFRKRGDDPALKGLPGVLKIKDCIRNRTPLSASRYLKTASVFGFHGIYRVLADNLDIIRNGFLGENGYALLEIWEKEQGLYGYHGGNHGPGEKRRSQIHGAVQEAMAKGVVCRSWSWDGWSFFSDHLFPNEIAEQEKEMLQGFFAKNGDGSRAEVIRFLVSKQGLSIFSKDFTEKAFHAALEDRATPETRLLLEAIEIYERFSRLLQDAFEDCLAVMTEKRGPTGPALLAKTEGCRNACQQVPEIFQEISDRLKEYELALRFTESFGSLSEKSGPEDWTRALLEHHIRVQRRKPPNGKNPWFERLDDGSVVVRAGYRKDEGGHHDGSYVNAYRTRPLLSFLSDLKMV